MPEAPRTRRLLDAQAAYAAAQGDLARLLQSGDPSTLAAATTALAVAQAELAAAVEESISRGQVASGARRRDRSISSEDEQKREELWARLSLPEQFAQTPAVKGHRTATEIEPWMLEALKKWSEHCNAMGHGTIARWFIAATLLKLGPPPGWEREWPTTVTQVIE